MYIHSYVDKYWASWFFMESMFRCCWYWKKKSTPDGCETTNVWMTSGYYVLP